MTNAEKQLDGPDWAS